MKKDTYYFSHDSNASNDSKILMMRSKYGFEGYGLYWSLIEIMRQQSNYKINLKHIDGIALTLPYDRDKLIEFIEYCSNDPIRLFSKKSGYLFSNSLIRRMKKVDEIRALRSEVGSKGGRMRAERMKTAKEKGDHTNKEWQVMKSFFDNKCVKCGKTGIQKDHIVPIYQEGSNAITNLQPLCCYCNTSKGNETIDYRLSRCEAIGKQMLQVWLTNGQAKSSKVKESKLNKIKDINDDVIKVLKSSRFFKDITSHKNFNEWLRNNIDRYHDIDICGEINKAHLYLISSGKRYDNYLLWLSGTWLKNAKNTDKTENQKSEIKDSEDDYPIDHLSTGT